MNLKPTLIRYTALTQEREKSLHQTRGGSRRLVRAMWELEQFVRSNDYADAELVARADALLLAVQQTDKMVSSGKTVKQALRWTVSAAKVSAAMFAIEERAGMVIPPGAAEHFTQLHEEIATLALPARLGRSIQFDQQNGGLQ